MLAQTSRFSMQEDGDIITFGVWTQDSVEFLKYFPEYW